MRKAEEEGGLKTTRLVEVMHGKGGPRRVTLPSLYPVLERIHWKHVKKTTVVP